MKVSIQKSWLMACVVGIAGSGLAQGSLTPPGTPAPTMKTLEQIEPRVDVMTLAGDANAEFIINTPGSYYLSDNFSSAKLYGVSIKTSGVTLDLNGFEILGTNSGQFYGINIKQGEGSITIRNGTITGEWAYGIRCNSPEGSGYLFEKLDISDCGTGMGAGEGARVLDCRIYDNAGDGIWAAAGAVISGCTVKNNGGYGIFSEKGSRISDCTTQGNGEFGIKVLSLCVVSGCVALGNQSAGITASFGSTIRDCTVAENQGSGISAGVGSSVSDCTAQGNQGRGISVAESSSVKGCTADGNNSIGIYANTGSSISDCTAKGNKGSYGIQTNNGSSIHKCSAFNNVGTGSSSYGIFAGTGSSVIACTAYNNSNTNSSKTASQGGGIHASSSSVVKDCSASYNSGDGIRVSGDCLVEGNVCDNNGFGGDGAGIHSSSLDNRIDGNTVTDNDRGIDVDSTGSLIVRNSASGNSTQYSIASGNDTGIIQSSPVGAGAWDNFSF